MVPLQLSGGGCAALSVGFELQQHHLVELQEKATSGVFFFSGFFYKFILTLSGMSLNH